MSRPDRVGVSAAFFLLKDNGAGLVFQSEILFNRLYGFLERLRGHFRIQGRVRLRENRNYLTRVPQLVLLSKLKGGAA